PLREGTDLKKVRVGDGWPVRVFGRMTLLCRDKGVRLGLITTGERWMIVNAPVGNTSSHISWYARLWFQEPVTLKAFQSLLSVRRWFGPEGETLPAMFEDSLQHHEEVTDTLGEQVKRAVEVLVQCLDKADQDRNRELLHDVPPAELYEAGLTVMMRLVFVLCAEERGLLLLGDSIYDQYYAISTLRGQLAEEADQHGHEVLERRHDAWARLLAVFRAVYGGIEHESLRMPALGGSLFDPNRFPFLEGRSKGTHWKDTPSQPLPIDNRTVLLLLEALQVLEQRGGALLLSYKALDVEQIGHVYEGLLEHTVRRLPKDNLGLMGSQKAKNPNLALAELESARLDSEEAVISLVETTTLRSRSAIANALAKDVDDATFGKIVTVCGGDMELAGRLKPFAHLLRTDAWGDFIVYHAHSFAVTLGADRRETGTHYTPKSLTESIVETTLEPVAYVGPAEGKPREEWLLKSSTELLELKICDPAMGSGAFLVQVCRWLSERLVEAWGKEQSKGLFITVDGESIQLSALSLHPSGEPMPDSLDERLLIARRLVAEKCLYGVDLNPLAVELAKLSIWLITLAKGRPFGFLDHNLRSGDSLLGLHKLEQLTNLSLHPETHRRKFKFTKFEQPVAEVLALRKRLRETPIRDILDVQYMERLDQQARQKLEHIEHIADAMIGGALASGGNQRTLETAMDNLSTWAAAYIEGDNETGRKIITEARKSLSIDLPAGKPPRKPFHWALEFPEVFERGGFDGIVGNPPFLGNKKISGLMGGRYRDYVGQITASGVLGLADLCAYFLLRYDLLLKTHGVFGVIASDKISQGDSVRVGLEQLCKKSKIINAIKSIPWPGRANVFIAILTVIKDEKYHGDIYLNNKAVEDISPMLIEQTSRKVIPLKLKGSEEIGFIGSVLLGKGFILTPDEAKCLITVDEKNERVIRSYLGGEDLNQSYECKPSRFVICFWDWELSRDPDLDQTDIPVAEDYHDCLSIVRENVKPERDTKNRKAYRERWWRFAELSKGAYEKTGDTDTVLIRARVSPTHALTFVQRGSIFSEQTVVFKGGLFEFGVMQSTIHELWAVRYSTSKGSSTLVYSPTSCLVTFPFPRTNGSILSNASEYYEYRKSVMVESKIGLTSVYNQFHSPDEASDPMQKLRDMHTKLDLAVAAAYDWDDFDLDHGFHETMQGIRFTISEEARREVLQRLLKLNHERYEEEVAQGLHDKKKKKTSTPRKKKTSPAKDDGNMDLFNFMNINIDENKS
nr:TetR family transcriptional regulator [Deltaproteobacteria bacterium]